MLNATPNGYEVPLHRSVVDRILIAGLPREFALVLWTAAAAFVLGLRIAWMLPIAIVLHLLCAGLTRHDPHFFEVFVRAVRHGHRLDP